MRLLDFGDFVGHAVDVVDTRDGGGGGAFSSTGSGGSFESSNKGVGWGMAEMRVMKKRKGWRVRRRVIFCEDCSCVRKLEMESGVQ